jgi:predicted CopG family antitoxin
MAKNISLSDDAYQKLSQEKRQNESFSDAVLRILDQRKSLTDVIGMKLLSPEISLEEIREASKTTLERLTNEGA